MTTSETEATQPNSTTASIDFEAFFAEVEPRLRAALVSKHGPDAGRDATAEALAYGWQAWGRVAPMTNPAGYLYRVGDRWASRQAGRRRRLLAWRSTDLSPTARSANVGRAVTVEPGLGPAIERLTLRQRQAVMLTVAFGLTHQEAADLLGLSRSSIQNHVERGMTKLRRELGANT